MADTYSAWISCTVVSPDPSTVKTPLLRATGRGLTKEMIAVSLRDTITSPIT